MPDKHLSTQFDAELAGISNRVLEMGGLVESQVAQAVYALSKFSGETSTQVLQQEERVNQMEVEIDRDLSAIIARRQPTARDLRLLIAISKSDRQPRTRRRRGRAHRPHRAAPGGQRCVESACACRCPTSASRRNWPPPSCARRSTRSRDWTLNSALRCAQGHDDEIDKEFDGLLRKLITYMMEDPRTISSSIDLVFVAKAIERVGDHAKNLAEVVIYVVKGHRRAPHFDARSCRRRMVR